MTDPNEKTDGTAPEGEKTVHNLDEKPAEKAAEEKPATEEKTAANAATDEKPKKAKKAAKAAKPAKAAKAAKPAKAAKAAKPAKAAKAAKPAKAAGKKRVAGTKAQTQVHTSWMKLIKADAKEDGVKPADIVRTFIEAGLKKRHGAEAVATS